jgi:hypothetical protein
MPVYSDPHQIPFAASYFNWLFYALYGSIISFIINLGALDEAWIPTIGRAITLTVVAIGFWINYRLFTSNKLDKAPLPFLLVVSLSALLWFGPLIGFWAMTVRPDVIALLFDMCAVFCLLKYLPKQIYVGVILAVLWCYLSWACKQVNIVMPVTIGLFLLIEKRWQAFILFSVLMGCSYAFTLLLANYNLLKTLFFINTAVPLSFDVMIGNLVNFIKKTIPVWVLFIAIMGQAIFSPSLRPRVFQDKMVRLSLCGLFAWSLILLPASSKIGSADNYHFIALFFLLLGIGGALGPLLEEKSRWMSGSIASSGILFIASVIFVISNGALSSINKQHEDNIVLKSCLNHYSQPIFVMNHYGALPWMNPSPISFVLAYNYWTDRNDNRPFEHNGIGGLIHQGYFNTLILPKYTATTFDGNSLANYQRQTECLGYAVFTKKERA